MPRSASTQGTDASARPSYRTREARRTGSLAAIVAFVTACGTGGSAEPPTPTPEPVEPTVADAWAADLSALRIAATTLGAEAAEHAGTERGVSAGRRAAALARVLALRDPEASWLGRARAWLGEASRRRALDGACEASMELARLEARDAGDPEAAYREAYRVSLRFDEDRDGCVEDAAAMMRTLEPWRPSVAELAALAADPDPDDPSAGHRSGDSRTPPATGTAALAAWAAERAAAEGATEGAEPAILTALSVYGHGASEEARSVRVVVRFDRVVAFEHGEADASGDLPHRTWFEIPAVRLGEGVQAAQPVDDGGLLRVRARSHETGARITFDLAPDARFRAFVLPEPFRIVLDVERGGERAEGPVRVLVLDPGHGGDDYGARAFGMHEEDLTLDIGRRVRALLARRLPDLRVILTRDSDVFVSLEQRAAMANSVDADLFLSIHLNAADEEVGRGGVTTFVLDNSDDRAALRLAARENGTTVGEVDSLSRLLASLHREDQVRASRAFAEQVHRATLLAGRRTLPRLYDRGVRSAMFYVLVGARMPAVLLEASFLSREEEAEALRTPEYRQSLAEGIAEGVVRWVGG
jgi:N-acetylmuramoyl-L-alanine amidase